MLQSEWLDVYMDIRYNDLVDNNYIGKSFSHVIHRLLTWRVSNAREHVSHSLKMHLAIKALNYFCVNHADQKFCFNLKSS